MSLQEIHGVSYFVTYFSHSSFLKQSYSQCALSVPGILSNHTHFSLLEHSKTVCCFAADTLIIDIISIPLQRGVPQADSPKGERPRLRKPSIYTTAGSISQGEKTTPAEACNGHYRRQHLPRGEDHACGSRHKPLPQPASPTGSRARLRKPPMTTAADGLSQGEKNTSAEASNQMSHKCYRNTFSRTYRTIMTQSTDFIYR